MTSDSRREEIGSAAAVRLAWRLFRMVRPHWRKLWAVLLVGVIYSAAGLITPLLTKRLVDEAFPSRDVSFMHLLVLGIFLTTLVRVVLHGVRSMYAQVLSQRLSAELGVLYYRHVLRLPAAFFDGRPTGEITSRAGDLQRGLAFVTNAFQTLVVSSAQLLLLLPILIALEWRLALLVLVLEPVTSAVSFAGGGVMRRRARRVSETSAEYTAVLMEVVANAKIVKSFAAEEEISTRIEARADNLRRRQSDAALWAAVLTAGIGVLRAGSTALMTLVAWQLILADELTLGGYFAFTMYLAFVSAPIDGIVGLTAMLQEIAVALSRFFEYFDLEQEKENATDWVEPPVLAGEVSFESVDFGYGAHSLVLKNVSMRLKGGRFHVIVGESGAGKSTLVRLLLRLYEPSGGRVLLDGVPLNQYPLNWLRRRIAVVWQENGLFRGTLRDNVRLGHSDASDVEVRVALEKACLSGMLQRVAGGLDSEVSEWGGSLSSGERQRLAIARALVRSPQILVLDEATANLDAATERSLMDELKSLDNVTIVFVTHRPGPVSHGDSVFLMREGSLRGGGTHRELLETDADYRALWFARPGTVPDAG